MLRCGWFCQSGQNLWDSTQPLRGTIFKGKWQEGKPPLGSTLFHLMERCRVLGTQKPFQSNWELTGKAVMAYVQWRLRALMRMREVISPSLSLSLSDDISELLKCRLQAGVHHLKATRGQAWQPEGLMCLRTGDQAVNRVPAFFLSESHFWG